MSWYFLGGFSAYFRVPSGRRLNHSGCSVSQGWSAEHWIAKSSATSMSCSRAAATNASKSSSVPSSGLTAVWPPSGPPIAHGLPGAHGALRQLSRQVGLRSRHLALELVAPRRERVGPCLQRPLPAPAPVERERTDPAIAAQVGVDPPQRRLVPFALRRRRVPVARHGP